MTASAVDGALTRSAFGRCSRRKRAHWAVACGCETTRSTVASESSRGGDHAVVDRVHHLRLDPHAGPASSASVSSVTATPPSSAFSIGTIARSTLPSWTAITAS